MLGKNEENWREDKTADPLVMHSFSQLAAELGLIFST